LHTHTHAHTTHTQAHTEKFVWSWIPFEIVAVSKRRGAQRDRILGRGGTPDPAIVLQYPQPVAQDDRSEHVFDVDTLSGS
jgi:hypothetical protein